MRPTHRTAHTHTHWGQRCNFAHPPTHSMWCRPEHELVNMGRTHKTLICRANASSCVHTRDTRETVFAQHRPQCWRAAAAAAVTEFSSVAFVLCRVRDEEDDIQLSVVLYMSEHYTLEQQTLHLPCFENSKLTTHTRRYDKRHVASDFALHASGSRGACERRVECERCACVKYISGARET